MLLVITRKLKKKVDHISPGVTTECFEDVWDGLQAMNALYPRLDESARRQITEIPRVLNVKLAVHKSESIVALKEITDKALRKIHVREPSSFHAHRPCKFTKTTLPSIPFFQAADGASADRLAKVDRLIALNLKLACLGEKPLCHADLVVMWNAAMEIKKFKALAPLSCSGSSHCQDRESHEDRYLEYRMHHYYFL
ncbi:unnamed protein product [Caenorhabditis nigoni]